jgi:lipase maturation factor 1
MQSRESISQSRAAHFWDSSPAKLARRIWYGPERTPPNYHIATAVFLRLLGVVYLLAFLSLYVQVDGLIGTHGIAPAARFLQAIADQCARAHPPVSPYWNLLTLAWLNSSDAFLNFLCLAGAFLSFLVMLGILQLPCLIMLWALYVSLYHVGQEFLSFQWDILLLETGFAAVFLAPTKPRSRLFTDRHPPRLALWLIWWLLFRLMLESGAVKLTWNRWDLGPDGTRVANTWATLAALDYHYWTQPLPIWTSWYAAKLPEWFQKLSALLVFVVELGLPWLIFAPRRGRYVACAGICLLMLLIGVTGNYNYFNLLTVATAITLLDDSAWPRALRERIRLAATSRVPLPACPPVLPFRWRTIALVPFALWAILVGTLQLKDALLPSENGREFLAEDLHVSQFNLVNSYGLFRQMTETRPEIIIEASDDGTHWQPYEFIWKPGDLARPPGFNTPHQPRLDWQMWFEALRLEQVLKQTGGIDPRYVSPWFRSFLLRLANAEPQVLALLAKAPFKNERPKYIRILLYQYRFTDTAEGRATGGWWRRDLNYTSPAMSLGQ